jgi:hypothetical protein
MMEREKENKAAIRQTTMELGFVHRASLLKQVL